jgi:hypothetical protein
MPDAAEPQPADDPRFAELEHLFVAIHESGSIDLSEAADARLAAIAQQLAASPATLTTVGLHARLAEYWNARYRNYSERHEANDALVVAALALAGLEPSKAVEQWVVK